MAADTGHVQDLMAKLQARQAKAPSSNTLGFRPLEIDPVRRWARGEFHARPEFCNPLGVVQGGFLTAMVDEIMAVTAVMSEDFQRFVPTLDMNVSFLDAARPGIIFGEGRVRRMGRTIAFLEGELQDADGRLLIAATATARVVERDKVVAEKE